MGSKNNAAVVGMKKWVILASLALALPAAAQQTGETAQLSTGEPVEPQVGETYGTGKFEAWERRCIKTPEGNDPCALYQLVTDDQGVGLAEVSIFPIAPQGQAVAAATFVTPLGTLLTANLVLSIDGSVPKRYPFNVCTEAGCVANVGFTAEELEKMKKGQRMSMTIVAAQAPNLPITVQISLKGFAKGYESLGS